MSAANSDDQLSGFPSPIPTTSCLASFKLGTWEFGFASTRPTMSSRAVGTSLRGFDKSIGDATP